MRQLFSVALLSSCALSAGAYEPLIKTNDQLSPVHAVVGLVFGWDWAYVGKNQDILFLTTDPAPDEFVKDSSTNSQPMGGALVGVEFPIETIGSLWQIAVAYYQANTFETQGIDYFYSQNNLGNKAYSYSLTSYRPMLENKLLVSLTDLFLGYPESYVYLTVGVGASINKAHNYKETALEPNTPATGSFSNHTETSLSYSAGIGFEVAFAEKLRGNIGYRFTDLGRYSLGTYSQADTNDSLYNNNTLVQEAIAQLTVLF